MKKVLLIEDDHDHINIFQVAFKDATFEFKVEDNGEDGVTKAIDWLPDIILLDIMLPGIDGDEVLKQLRANPRTKDVPIIIFTNFFQKDINQKIIELGATEIWQKSDITPNEVLISGFCSQSCI